jgi:probable HAF family extracellular repeat protein
MFSHLAPIPRFSVLAAAAIALVGLIAAWPVPAGEGGPKPSYTLTDLKGFTGGTGLQSDARAMSDPDPNTGLVWITGKSLYQPVYYVHPALWKVDTTGNFLSLVDLGNPLDAVESEGLGVNPSGLTVGRTVQSGPSGSFPGFVDGTGFGMLILPTLGGHNAEAIAINRNGDIAGVASDASDVDHVVLWNVNTNRHRTPSGHYGNIAGPRDLGLRTVFEPMAINDSGTMAGITYAESEIYPATAYVDSGGVLQVTRLRIPAGRPRGVASAINNNGLVVGAAGHAILWRSPTDFTDLGTLGGRTSWAYGINDAGVVVGLSDKANGDTVAFIYENGTMKDLNTLAGTGTNIKLQSAAAINNSGQIVGNMRIESAVEEHGFLLTPK